MGSLMIAGAVGGLGKGMVDNATASRAQADKDAERMHTMQLDRQRNRAASEAADTRFGREQELANTQYGRDVSLQDKGFQQELAGQNVEQGYADLGREDDQAHALELQRMKNKGLLDASGHSASNAKNKWTTTQQPAGFDDEGRAMYDYIAERNGIQYKQIGDKYVEVGLPSGSPEPEDFGGDKAMQRRAESDLMNGEMTADEFKDSFFYIPRKFIDRESNNAGTSFGESGSKKIKPIPGELEDVFAQSGTMYQGVTAPMLKAIAYVESKFDPAAMSEDGGAYGIAQFREAAMKDVGLTKEQAMDPNIAIPAMAKYMNTAMEAFAGQDQQAQKAVAAFHGGVQGVKDAIAAGGEDGWFDALEEARPDAINENYLAEYAAAFERYSQGGNLEQPAGNMLADAASTEMGPPGPVDPSALAGPPGPPDPNAFNGPWAPPPPPDYGAVGSVTGAIGTGAGGAGGAVLEAGKGAVGAITEGARLTKEALFGKPQ